MDPAQSVAYILHSGGIDSTTAVARARRFHADVRCVSIDYGQRHSREIAAAREIADHYGLPHEVVRVEMPRTMLTDPSIAVPDVSYSEITGVSPTYVPYRNGVFLSMITSLAAGRHLDPTRRDHPDFDRDVTIYAGMHAEDAAGGAYPDCFVEFTGAQAAAIYVGTYRKIRLITPFISMMKHEIIRLGAELGAPYSLSWSCYRGGDLHCGTCATCRARREAFVLAGVPDPTRYAS